MKITEPGIYYDVATADYFADPCIAPSFTQSLAKLMLERSPQHVWTKHPRLNPIYVADDEGYRKDLAIGNAAHKLMLGRGKELAVIAVDDFRTKDAQKQRDDAIERGAVPILMKHYVTAEAMVETAVKQLDDMDLNVHEGRGNTEVVIAWEEEGGIWLRSMIDFLSTDLRLVVDYKTTSMSCSPYAIGQKLVKDGFDVQAAFHERGLDVLDPASAGRRRHLFICQESSPPFALTVCQLPEAVLHIGRRNIEMAIAMWSNCVWADRWPGYPNYILVPLMPQWAENRWLEREERGQLNIMAAG